MTNTKTPLQSTTVWGLIISLIMLLKDRLGWNLSEGDAEQIVNVGGQVVGLVIALVGRWRADKPLAVKDPPKDQP